MTRIRRLQPQSIFDENALVPFLEEHGFKACALHARNICKHLIRTRATTLDGVSAVPNLPAGVDDLVRANFTMCTSKVKEQHTSSDGTIKLLVELQDGMTVEAVIIPGGATTGDCPKGNPRTTLCVSSQIGCKMGCTFCATGTMGEIGHLNAGEICEQLWHANHYRTVRNVVFMGMGEPLNNYPAVRAAVRAMTDVHRFRLSPTHVTVSTVGVIPRILDLAEDLPGVNLALSLHAPTQELRKTFVPSASGAPLDRLMGAVDTYLEKTGRKVLVEYCLLAGENDTVACAAQLAQLMRGRDVTVNLIPYNPTYNPRLEQPHRAPTHEAVQRFQDMLYKAGLRATVRKEKGQDIAGACGQLVVDSERRAGRGGDGGGGGASCATGGGVGGSAGAGASAAAGGPLPAAGDIEDLVAGGGGHADRKTSPKRHAALRRVRSKPGSGAGVGSDDAASGAGTETKPKPTRSLPLLGQRGARAAVGALAILLALTVLLFQFQIFNE